MSSTSRLNLVVPLAAVLGVMAALSVVAATPALAGPSPTLLYVEAGGSDSGDCSTSAAACATVQYAIGEAAQTAEILVGFAGSGDDFAGWTDTSGKDLTILNAFTDATITSTIEEDNSSGSESLQRLGVNVPGGDDVDDEAGSVTLNDDDIDIDTVGVVVHDTADLIDTTLAANTVNVGVGLKLDAGAASVTNSGAENLLTGFEADGGSLTMSDSTSGDNGTGVLAAGGSATVTDSTLFGDVPNGVLASSGSVSLAGSLIASDEGSSALDCDRSGGTISISGGYNIADDSSCGTTTTNQDVDDSLLKLTFLANHEGSPTPSELPDAGSAVIDQIPAGLAGCPLTTGVSTDQAAKERLQGGMCDVGSMEHVVAITGADCNAITGNLVANCSFESGSPGGEPDDWTLASASDGFSDSFLDTEDPLTGSAALALGAAGADDDAVSQTVTGTSPSTSYTLTYWLANRDSGSSDFSVTVSNVVNGPQTFDAMTDPSPFGYKEFTDTFTTLASGDPTVSFNGRHMVYPFQLDDVAVVPTGSLPPTPQTISFTPPTSGTYDDTIDLSTDASGGGSGNPVTFTVDPSSLPSDACLLGTGSNDTMLTFTDVGSTAPGSCVVDADQAGGNGYAAATEVSETIAVDQATQTISFTPPTSGTVGQQIDLSSGTSGGDSGNTVTYKLDIATDPADACSLGSDGHTLTLTDVGSSPPGLCVVDADQAGTDNYSAASTVIKSIDVEPASQSITFTPPASGVVGSPITLSATGGNSGNDVTFMVDPSSGTGVCATSGTDGSTLTFNAAGSCVVDANQLGSDDYTAATQVQKTIAVSASSGGGGGGGGGSSTAGMSQTITVTAPGSGDVGTSATVTATGGGSGNPVVLTEDPSSTPGACTISGTTVALTGVAGSCVIDANQAGGNGYNAAPQVQVTIKVVKASPGISDPTITAKVTSTHARHHGWYRGPVTVTFTCNAGSSVLVGSCPAPVVLSKGGKNLSVSKIIDATDGGTGSVEVSGINIDLGKPKLHVTGATNGGLYSSAPTLKCVATDSLSGVASCVITRHHTTRDGVRHVTWTAVATDVAGNKRTIHGHFRVDA